jgi:mono/diheme cytochrome c family protein
MKRALICAVTLLALAAPAHAAPDAAVKRGEMLYNQTCIYCHDQNGWATRDLARRFGQDRAVLTQRGDLSQNLIRYVVRHGIGNMPAFTPTDLSGGDIDAIAEYLHATDAKETGAR